MNRWLKHFGIVFVGTAVVALVLRALTDWELPAWIFPAWVVGSVLLTLPLDAALARTRNRRVVAKLEAMKPESVAAPVEVSFKDVKNLLALLPRMDDASVGERYRHSARLGRALEYPAVLISDDALELWGGGDSGSPQRVVDIRWGDVRVGRTTRHLIVVRGGRVLASLTLIGHSLHSAASRQQLDRRILAAIERAERSQSA